MANSYLMLTRKHQTRVCGSLESLHFQQMLKIIPPKSFLSLLKEPSVCLAFNCHQQILWGFHHANRDNLLSDKQYGFQSARSSADILNVIMQSISEALDNKYVTKTISLDTLKVFDKVWHMRFLHKLSNYRITSRVLSIIKSLLTWSMRSMQASCMTCFSVLPFFCFILMNCLSTYSNF